MKKTLLASLHAISLSLGFAAGNAYQAAQPHPPLPGEVGFTLLVQDSNGDYVAKPLVYGTDDLLHEVP